MCVFITCKKCDDLYNKSTIIRKDKRANGNFVFEHATQSFFHFILGRLYFQIPKGVLENSQKSQVGVSVDNISETKLVKVDSLGLKYNLILVCYGHTRQ